MKRKRKKIFAPKLKQMKLNSCQSEKEINRPNLSIGNKDHLKIIFPTYSEEQIFEILQKSENNLDKAKKLIEELKYTKITGNNSYINLHKENRKRRLDDDYQISNFNFSNFHQREFRENNNIQPVQRKFFKRPEISKKEIKNQVLEDRELDSIINDITTIQNKEGIKLYLNKKITEIIKTKLNSSKSQNNLLQNTGSLNNIQNDQIDLKADNDNLKKIQGYLARKCKELQGVEKKRNDRLRELIIEKEKLKNEEAIKSYYNSLISQFGNSN